MLNANANEMMMRKKKKNNGKIIQMTNDTTVLLDHPKGVRQTYGESKKINIRNGMLMNRTSKYYPNTNSTIRKNLIYL